MNDRDLFGPLDILDDTPTEYDPTEDGAERHARGWARSLKARLAERDEIYQRYDEEITRLVEAKEDRLAGVDKQIGYLKRAIEEAHIAVNKQRKSDNLDELATWDLVHVTSKSRRVPKKDLTRIAIPTAKMPAVADALEQAGFEGAVTRTPKVPIKEIKALVAAEELAVSDGQIVISATGELIDGFEIEVLADGTRTYTSTINE